MYVLDKTDTLLKGAIKSDLIAAIINQQQVYFVFFIVLFKTKFNTLKLWEIINIFLGLEAYILLLYFWCGGILDLIS